MHGHVLKWPDSSRYILDTVFLIVSAFEYFPLLNCFLPWIVSTAKKSLSSKNWNIVATIWICYNFQIQKRILSWNMMKFSSHFQKYLRPFFWTQKQRLWNVWVFPEKRILLILVLKGVVFTTLNLSVKCVHRDWFDYRSKIALTTWFCREMEHTSFIILQHTFLTSIAIKNQ